MSKKSLTLTLLSGVVLFVTVLFLLVFHGFWMFIAIVPLLALWFFIFVRGESIVLKSIVFVAVCGLGILAISAMTNSINVDLNFVLSEIIVFSFDEEVVVLVSGIVLYIVSLVIVIPFRQTRTKKVVLTNTEGLKISTKVTGKKNSVVGTNECTGCGCFLTGSEKYCLECGKQVPPKVNNSVRKKSSGTHRYQAIIDKCLSGEFAATGSYSKCWSCGAEIIILDYHTNKYFINCYATVLNSAGHYIQCGAIITNGLSESELERKINES